MQIPSLFPPARSRPSGPGQSEFRSPSWSGRGSDPRASCRSSHAGNSFAVTSLAAAGCPRALAGNEGLPPGRRDADAPSRVPAAPLRAGTRAVRRQDSARTQAVSSAVPRRVALGRSHTTGLAVLETPGHDQDPEVQFPCQMHDQLPVIIQAGRAPLRRIPARNTLSPALDGGSMRSEPGSDTLSPAHRTASAPRQ